MNGTELSKYCDAIENIHDRYIAAQAFMAGYLAGLTFADEVTARVNLRKTLDPYQNVEMTPDKEGRTTRDVNDQ